MHDVLEGVLQYEAKEFLKYAINEQSYFSLEQLNQWIQHFDFGYADSSNRPSPIAGQTLNSVTNSLKQKGNVLYIMMMITLNLYSAKIHKSNGVLQSA